MDVDVQKAINITLDQFAKQNSILHQCQIFKIDQAIRTYFFINAMSGPIRQGGPYTSGPTWMTFGLAGEGMDRDLMVRGEMLIGEVDSLGYLAYASDDYLLDAAKAMIDSNSLFGLAWVMTRHYTNTSPFYATCEIQKRYFLFMIQDFLVPLSVGQDSMEARLISRMVINMMSDDIPGINRHPDVMDFAVKYHAPYLWDHLFCIENIDISL